MGNKPKQLKVKGKKFDVLKDFKLESQTKSFEGALPKDYESEEIKNELHKIKRYKNKVIGDNLFYESRKQIYDFKIFKTTRYFVQSIYNRKIEIHEANQKQADLIQYILSFNHKTKKRSDENKNKKMIFLIVQKISISVEN